MLQLHPIFNSAVKRGGLGIHSAVHLASSSLLTSTSASRDLVSARFSPVEMLHIDIALASLYEDHNSPAPQGPAVHRQKLWDVYKVSSKFDALLESAQDAQAKAHLLAASVKESGAWLNVFPISTLA